MNFADIVLTPYTWRGKTYKDIRNLFRAVDKVHPRASVSFTQRTMHVRDRDTNITVNYAVERGTENAIAAEPMTEARS